ncbi:hypothetical protein HKBW3C_02613, partial [Candidatus Hakubella thermalkaliphila]
EIRSRVFRERGHSWVEYGVYGVLVYIVVSIVSVSTLVGWEEGPFLPNIILFIIMTILWPLTLIYVIILSIILREWVGWHPFLLIAFTGISTWIFIALVRRSGVSMEVTMKPEEERELSLRTETIEYGDLRKLEESEALTAA